MADVRIAVVGYALEDPFAQFKDPSDPPSNPNLFETNSTFPRSKANKEDEDEPDLCGQMSHPRTL